MIEMCCEYLSVWCICLHVLIMSRTHFRVNPQSRVAEISGKSLFELGAKYEVYVTATGLERTTTWLVKEHSTIWD